MGAVFSHTPGFTSLGALWPALAFHAVSGFAGVLCLGRATAPKPATA